MLNKFILLLLILFCFACNKNDEIPSYLKIDNVSLNYDPNFGSNSENITDVWVYIEENLQGVYEIPVEFPILQEGLKSIRIKGGVKANGIASTRIQYPFFTSYLDTVELIKDQSITIAPIFSYNNSFEAIIEDFENSGTIIDSTLNSEIDFSIETEIQNNYGYANIESPNINFEIATQDLNLPQQGAPVYLELDYKSSTEFLVGMYINYPQSVLKSELIWVTAKENWNKIYINLTSTVSEAVGADFFKVFVGMQRDFTLDENNMCFDNLKVIY